MREWGQSERLTVGVGVLDDFDFEGVYAGVFGELSHESVGDCIGELLSEVCRGVEDAAVVEYEVDMGGLVGVVAACT